MGINLIEKIYRRKKRRIRGKTAFLIMFIIIHRFTVGGNVFSRQPEFMKTVIPVQFLNKSVSTAQIRQNMIGTELAAICLSLYRQAAKDNKLSDLDTIRSIVKQLGIHGYPAVDRENQVDMEKAEQVLAFCEKVKSGKEAEITVIEVNDQAGFARYDLHTGGGTVDVVRSYYKYENETLRREAMVSYRAENWNETEEGYLMFSGAYFSDVTYILTLNEEEIYTAWRVLPLDKRCRELNRKYFLPIGYGRNNMFLVNWNEDDFGELNFYDLYDILRPKTGGRVMPYTAVEDLGFGAVYRIPKEGFEGVIMDYFKIDAETLRRKTVYYPEDGTYEYRPRGYYEAEYPEYPYPEVTGYAKNEDGTITLSVQAVFPAMGDSRAYAHEVVVRPLANGGMQYVSNRVCPSDDYGDNEAVWHVPRLERDKWEEIYGGK